MFHDSEAGEVLVVKLSGDGGVPAHLSLQRPVGHVREPIARRRATTLGGVDRRPGRDVAVAESYDDVWSEVGPFDGRSTRQRRSDVLSQS